MVGFNMLLSSFSVRFVQKPYMFVKIYRHNVCKL